MRRLAWLLVTFLLACDPELAPAPPAPDPNLVQIGLLNPFSGREAARALDFENAARLAVYEINQAGGVNGRQLGVILRDSKTSEPEEESVSIAAVEALAAANVVAIVGPDTSNLVIAITPKLVEHGIPLISPTASAAALTSLADEDCVWRTAPSDAIQGRALAQRIRRDGPATLAIVYRDDIYGQGLSATVATAFDEGGGETLVRVPYPPMQRSEFEPTIDALYAAGTPDAIVVIGFALDSAGVLTALSARSLTAHPALYGVDGNHNQAMLDNAPPELLVGMRFIAPGSPMDNQSLADFVIAYDAMLDRKPFRTEFTYDAIYLIALALVQAGDNSAEAVRTHLREVSRPDGEAAVAIAVGADDFARAVQMRGADLDYHGASGAIDYDAAGDVTSAFFAIREVQDSDDGLVFVDLERVNVP